MNSMNSCVDVFARFQSHLTGSHQENNNITSPARPFKVDVIWPYSISKSLDKIDDLKKETDQILDKFSNPSKLLFFEASVRPELDLVELKNEARPSKSVGCEGSGNSPSGPTFLTPHIQHPLKQLFANIYLLVFDGRIDSFIMYLLIRILSLEGLEMSNLNKKGSIILAGGFLESSRVYRGILELAARFGYLSIREVMYAFDLPLKEASNRLRYLERIKLIKHFPSQALPNRFFCLTGEGRYAVNVFQISDEINFFKSEKYTPTTQVHSRTLAKIYVALRKTFGSDLLNWASETTLKKESGKTNGSDSTKGRRVLDGEFQLLMNKTRSTQDSAGDVNQQKAEKEAWWCGLELELTVKSSERYRKQFRSLAGNVFNSFDEEQKVPLVLFLYNTGTVFKRLIKHLKEVNNDFGKCLFYLGQADRFLNELGSAPMVRLYKGQMKEVVARDMNQLRFKARS